MAPRLTVTVLSIGMVLLFGGCARSILSQQDARLTATLPVHLDGGTRAEQTFYKVGLSSTSERVAPCTPVCDEPEVPCWCEDRFHVTTARLWFYQSFVPDKSDPTTLGVEVDSEWGMGRLNVSNISYLELADYPVAVPGQPVGNGYPGIGAATGITDLLTAFLFSPKKPAWRGDSPHHFAAGFAAQFPTASDKTLGSGKWSAGPAVEYEYECGRLYAAFVALNLFSFAGDEDRKTVNMFMLKPMITYELNSCWKAVYMPYGVSIYWNKKPGQKVYLPLGGGMQYDFRIGSQKTAISLQYFYNVLRPTGGTEHDLRLMVEFDF